LSAISRRAVIAGALALPVAARAGPARQVKALNWIGTARVEIPGRTLVIEVKTRVEPFVRARSETRLAGTSDTRTLIIEPNGGFTERDAKRTPLPPAQALHERQQYGLYGYMVRALGDMRKDVRNMTYTQQGFPPIDFHFGGDGLGTADYSVDGPEGGKVAQHLRFSGVIAGGGLQWVRQIDIDQAGTPYFTLELAQFAAELA
jgi:hypothetical protein